MMDILFTTYQKHLIATYMFKIQLWSITNLEKTRRPVTNTYFTEK